MTLRWRWPVLLCGVLFAAVWVSAARAEEPVSGGAGGVPDPAVEQAITDALNSDKAVAYPAIKKLAEFGGAARRALDTRLFNEKTQRGRVQLAEIIARACDGRVAYRITLDLNPDGSGKLRLESDRTMLAECARKFDKINGNPATVYDEEELRRNPYGRGDLAKHMEGGMKYVLGDSNSRDGRIIASGEVSFSNFDEFSAFATSFDRSGYHMLNGITLADNNNLRTLHFKKTADQNQSAARYLLLFHDVKWEFVLDFKGQIQNSNATSMARNKFIWTFNCAQMLTGEAEIEASFDPRQALGGNAASAPGVQPVPVQNNDPTAIVASKIISVMMGKRDDDGKPITRGPDYEVLLDGRQSSPAGPDLHYQWLQTAGIPLNLPKERIAIPVIKMLIYQPGEYRFELTVAKDDKISAPTEVLVLVGESMKPEITNTVAFNTAANGQNSTERQYEIPFKEPKVERPKRGSEQAALNPGRNVVPVPAVVDAGGNRIELSLIQQVEDEYRRNRAAGGSSSNLVVPNSLVPVVAAAEREAVQTTIRLPAPRAGDLPAAPPIPAIPPASLNTQPSEVVVSNDNSLAEIRKTEAQFNQSKSAPPVIQRSVPVPPVPPVVIPVPAVLPPPVVTPVVPPVVISKPIIPPVPIEPEVHQVKPEPKVQPAPAPVEVPREVKPVPSKENTKQELKDFEAALKGNGTDGSKKSASAPPVTPMHIGPQPVEPLANKLVSPPIAAVPAAQSTAGVGSTREQGLALMKAGKYAAAVETFKRANAAKPEEETQLQLGIAMFNAAEKPDGYDRSGLVETVNVFEDILAKNPKNLSAIMYYGHAQSRLENMPQAAQIYREGVRLGGDPVRWESTWQLGNKALKGKDYEMALTMFKDAQETAAKAKVTDVRLERDFAAAYHGAKQDDEALKHGNNVLAMGYALDPQLATELKIANTPGTTASVEPKNVLPAVLPAPVVPAPVKPAEIKVADVKPALPAVLPVASGAPKTSTPSDMEERFRNLYNNKDQVAADQRKLDSAKPPIVVPVPPVPVGVQPVPAVAAEIKKTAEPIKVAPAPAQTVTELETQAKKIMGIAAADSAAAAKTNNPDLKPARVKKKLPPVPQKYEDAMAAAKRALDRGLKLSGQKDEALKTQVQDAWDETEVMLRGAWDMKPANKDAEVLEQFTELSKQVGAIALVTSQNLISKKNGLVILNADPSVIFPAGRQLFYAWEQVEGPELDLRRENLTSKKLGLRIKDPGIYKFELVVSDGVRGGNPVTVTVEVEDRGL